MEKQKIQQAIITLCIFMGVAVFVAFNLSLRGADVKKLRDHYPHFTGYQGKSLKFSLKKRRPKFWVTIKKINPITKGSFILSEDWAFYQHQGLDLKQLRIVIERFIKTGKLSRGASTITQQVVKNIFLSHERSIFRKLKEMYLAVELERTLSKEKILEHYLNIIELGKNVVGVGQGSYHYFGKSAYKLLPREAAFLTMLLPNPKLYSISFKQKKLTPFAQQRLYEIGVKLRMGHYLNEKQRLEYFSMPFSWESFD
jgi:monofunctional biosynthetic peptidoglycan transglycosylase